MRTHTGTGLPDSRLTSRSSTVKWSPQSHCDRSGDSQTPDLLCKFWCNVPVQMAQCKGLWGLFLKQCILGRFPAESYFA